MLDVVGGGKNEVARECAGERWKRPAAKPPTIRQPMVRQWAIRQRARLLLGSCGQAAELKAGHFRRDDFHRF